MSEPILPVVKSMVLCEDVLPGPDATGNVHLMNVFTAITPRTHPQYPLLFPQICVFLQITDHQGAHQGQIRVRNLSTDRLVFGSSMHQIELESRLQLKLILFRIRNCPFPESGIYSVEFYWDGIWITDWRLQLKE